MFEVDWFLIWKQVYIELRSITYKWNLSKDIYKIVKLSTIQIK